MNYGKPLHCDSQGFTCAMLIRGTTERVGGHLFGRACLVEEKKGSSTRDFGEYEFQSELGHWGIDYFDLVAWTTTLPSSLPRCSVRPARGSLACSAMSIGFLIVRLISYFSSGTPVKRAAHGLVTRP